MFCAVFVSIIASNPWAYDILVSFYGGNVVDSILGSC